MKEIWKDVVGYERLYKVSNYGKVKGLDRKLKDNRNWKGRLLKQEINHGYLRVRLCKNNIKVHKRVHILVAEAFIHDKSNFKSMPDEDRSKINLDDLVINHKDENKQNNNVDNLEWCTAKYNSNYGECLLKIAKKLAKPIAQYDLNNNFIKNYESISDASRKTGYNISFISDCCNGKYKQAYGYIWKFVNIEER